MIKDENYIQISGWMINELNLKGNELLIYALIHGFSQDGKSVFSGSLSYIADWTNSTKQGVIKSLKSLEEKKLIVKVIRQKDAATRLCEYFTAKSRERKTVSSGDKPPEARQGTSTTQENSGKLSLPPDQATEFTTIQNESGKPSLPPIKLSLPNKNFEILVNSTSTFPGNEAEEIISHTLKKLFGGHSVFDPSFAPAIASLAAQFSLRTSALPDYLTYVLERAKAKKPKSLTNFYYATAKSPAIMQDFISTHSGTKERQKQTCPVCGALFTKAADCPQCSFSLQNADDRHEVETARKIWLLPEAVRDEFRAELRPLLMGSTDFRPEAIAERKRKIASVYQKYGITG